MIVWSLKRAVEASVDAVPGLSHAQAFLYFCQNQIYGINQDKGDDEHHHSRHIVQKALGAVRPDVACH